MTQNPCSHLFVFDHSFIRSFGMHLDSVFVVEDLCRALRIQDTKHALAKSPVDSSEHLRIAGHDYEVIGHFGVCHLCRHARRRHRTLADRFERWFFDVPLTLLMRWGPSSPEDDTAWLLQAYPKALSAEAKQVILHALKLHRAIKIPGSGKPHPFQGGPRMNLY